MRATRAIIHLENLRHNIDAISKKAPQSKLCVPVKADAYGHGAVQVSLAALACGADCLAIASVLEGEALRKAGIDAPILLLSLPIPEECDSIIDLGITPLVTDPVFASSLAEAARRRGKRVGVHLKVDSGMGRIGVSPEKALALARAIAAEKELFIEGTCTHLCVSDSLDPGDLAFTTLQLERFDQAIESLRKDGIDPGIRHAAASGGLLYHPESHLDMVRPGILCYGYLPAPNPSSGFDARPVMELATQITFLKRVEAGTPISYGRTWESPRETVIATLPVGYADGVPRALSNKGRVLVGGRPCPIVGRVCMDQLMVDLGPEAKDGLYDQVTVFGPQECADSAFDVAEATGTIPYEITCNVNKRVPRVYVPETGAFGAKGVSVAPGAARPN
jgi:alanine racemase